MIFVPDRNNLGRPDVVILWAHFFSVLALFFDFVGAEMWNLSPKVRVDFGPGVPVLVMGSVACEKPCGKLHVYPLCIFYSSGSIDQGHGFIWTVSGAR